MEEVFFTDAEAGLAQLAAASNNPVSSYLDNLDSPRSADTMIGGLRSILRLLIEKKFSSLDPENLTRENVCSFPWHTLRYEHVQAIRAMLMDRYRVGTTAQLYMHALRGVLKECWRMKLIDSEAYHRAIDIKPIKGDKTDKGRAIPLDDLKKVFSHCAAINEPMSLRDAALIAIMFYAGLRRAEAASLDLEDYDREKMTIRVRLGKGKKTRTVPLSEEGCKVIDTWLEARKNIIPETCNALFTRFQKGGHTALGERITPQTVYNVLRSRSQGAGIATIEPHDLRRSFATYLFEVDTDVFTVQDLMGHEKIDITKRYDKRGDRAKKKAVGVLSVNMVLPE